MKIRLISAHGVTMCTFSSSHFSVELLLGQRVQKLASESYTFEVVQR